MALGIETLNFGASPGSLEATFNVTGQTGILTSSSAEAWLRIEATADHTVDEIKAMADNIDVQVDDSAIVAGTGFPIIMRARRGLIYGQVKANWGWGP